MRYMSPHAPKSDRGTVTLGMTVAQNVRRKMKMTATTSPMVKSNVSCTSSTAARMVCVRSLKICTLIEGGMAACKRGSWPLMRSTVSMTLAPGCLKTMRNTPLLPEAQAAFLASSGPATARPMSRTRSGAPLR
jgi:hypothetical protein